MIRPRRGAVVLASTALLLSGAAVPAAAGAPPQRTWHADQTRVPDARTPGRSGEGVLVAVLDTWVDAAHPDFEGRVLVGADCSGGSCREGTPAPDQCTHGTHVAGTVASSSYGVAPRANVLPVKVLAYSPPRPGQSASCSGSADSVAAAIRYAAARGARVVNLSVGTMVPGLSSSSEIAGAVAEAARAGAVVVFAAGNSRVPLADSYGGNALIVAATGPDGSLASYSQRGAGVTLAAPGGDPPTFDSCTPQQCVTSLFPGAKYAVAAGTSMAAPHVSGIAALLFGQDPARSRQSVVDRLRSTARPLAGAGDGLVDATAALGGPAMPGSPARSAPAAAPGSTPTAGGGTSTPPPAPGMPPQQDAAPAPAGQAAPDAAGAPVQPDPAPSGGGSDPGPAESPVDDVGTDAAAAAGAEEELPPGPPALALALLLTAGLTTALVGLRRPTQPRR